MKGDLYNEYNAIKYFGTDAADIGLSVPFQGRRVYAVPYHSAYMGYSVYILNPYGCPGLACAFSNWCQHIRAKPAQYQRCLMMNDSRSEARKRKELRRKRKEDRELFQIFAISIFLVIASVWLFISTAKLCM